MTRFVYLLPLALLTLALPVKAQQADDNLQARATVARSCSITQLQSIDFGKYDSVTIHGPLGTSVWVSKSLQVKCTAGMSGVTLRFDRGNSTQGTFKCPSVARYLVGPNNKKLTYWLHADDGRVWGCHTNNTSGDGMTEILEPFTDSLNARQINFKGVLSRGQDVPMGTYVDTISVGLTF